jgi:hypothetical protein
MIAESMRIVVLSICAGHDATQKEVTELRCYINPTWGAHLSTLADGTRFSLVLAVLRINF